MITSGNFYTSLVKEEATTKIEIKEDMLTSVPFL
jgi:hypothetical protein